MNSTPVTRRSKRTLTAPHSKKRQKTSTPSKSRIEHYMSPGNISKVAGSPIQQSTLQSINETTDRSGRGEESSFSLRSSFSQRLGDGDKNKKTSKLVQLGDQGDAVGKHDKSTDDEGMETSELSQTGKIKKRQKQTVARSRTSSRKKANLSTTLQNATIDKFLSPDISSSAITTPTRFPRDKDNDSSENEETTVVMTKKRKEESHQKSVGSLNLSEDEPSTSTGIDQSKENDGASKSNGKVRIKGNNPFLASGDVKTHMEDKEFLASQVHILTKPFTMDGSPRQWMNTWKACQSASQNDDGEMEDIPEKVIHNAISKLNYAMKSDLDKCLSRQQQRKVLINMDEIQKEERCDQVDDRRREQNRLKMGATLEEIIEHYPSKWPSTDDVEESESEDESEMAQRYNEVYARLSTLAESLIKKEQEREQLQNMCSQLKEIDDNLRNCTDNDFKNELDRTQSLVSQILKKLTQRRSPRKHGPSEHTKATKEPVSKESYQLAGHEAIVRHLFSSF